MNLFPMVGGNCPKNKIFYSEAEARKFIKANPQSKKGAKKEMLKSPAKAFAMLKDKKKGHYAVQYVYNQVERS